MALDAGVHQTNTTETDRSETHRIRIAILDDQPLVLLGIEHYWPTSRISVSRRLAPMVLNVSKPFAKTNRTS